MPILVVLVLCLPAMIYKAVLARAHAVVVSVPEKLGFRRYNQEIQFGKGLYLVDQYFAKVCGKNYLNDGSVKG